MSAETWIMSAVGICCMFVGFAFGYGWAEKDYQCAAVKHGAATWEVHDDGSTKFKWREGG